MNDKYIDLEDDYIEDDAQEQLDKTWQDIIEQWEWIKINKL